MDVGADVLDQIVMDDDVLCQPIEVARGIHARGAHRAVCLNSRDKAQRVGQRAGLTGPVIQDAGVRVETGLLVIDRLLDLVSLDRELHVALAALVLSGHYQGSKT